MEDGGSAINRNRYSKKRMNEWVIEGTGTNQHLKLHECLYRISIRSESRRRDKSMADEELVEGVWGIVSVPVEIEHRAFSGSGPPVRHLRGANNKTHRFFLRGQGRFRSLSLFRRFGYRLQQQQVGVSTKQPNPLP